MANDHFSEKLLSIPPFFATSWDQVAALKATETSLHIYLKSGQEVILPGVDSKTVQSIFLKFNHLVEGSIKFQLPEKTEQDKAFEAIQKGLKEVLSLTMKLGISALGKIETVLEHNPGHAQLPPLPAEMIDRIQVLANIIPKEDLAAMSPPIAGCNCLYCQIQRIIRSKEPSIEIGHADKEEVVEDQELQFSEWSVTPIADKLYKVNNKLDPHEEYQVFLGDPMGCTCGKPHCEHIIAVLRS